MSSISNVQAHKKKTFFRCWCLFRTLCVKPAILSMKTFISLKMHECVLKYVQIIIQLSKNYISSPYAYPSQNIGSMLSNDNIQLERVLIRFWFWPAASDLTCSISASVCFYTAMITDNSFSKNSSVQLIHLYLSM